MAKCTEIFDGPSVVKTGTDQVGDWALHKIKDVPADHMRRYVPAREPDRASLETLDTVYTALFSQLQLSDTHRTQMRERDLTDDQISSLGVRTLPHARTAVAMALRKQFGDTLKTVPGFHFDDGKLYLLGNDGMLIPVRNVDQQLVAVKIRRDVAGEEESRYVWLSSSSREGPGPGAPCHVPVMHEPSSVSDFNATRRIQITEGPLKAEIIQMRSGMRTLGMAGASAINSALEVTKALGVTTVRLAFDADKATNTHVALAFQRACLAIEKAGHVLEIAHWPLDAGKGLDDVLQNCRAASVHIYTAKDAWRLVLETVRAAKALPDAEVLAKNGIVPGPLDDLIPRTIEDVRAAFDPAVIDHAAKLYAENRGEYVALRKTLIEEAEMPYRDWSDWEHDVAKRDRERQHEATAKEQSKRDSKDKDDPHCRRSDKFEMRRGEVISRATQKNGTVQFEKLATFSALLTAERVETDGTNATPRRVYEVETYNAKGRKRVLQIPATDFDGMGWVTQLGSSAYIAAGASTKDRVREAIKDLSGDIPERRVFTTLGWVNLDGKSVYLHAGGGIGGEVDVAVEAKLKRFLLPAIPDQAALTHAFGFVVRLLEESPVLIPIIAAAFRAAIGESHQTVYISGEKGNGKTLLATLGQQFFGAQFSEKNPPATLQSSANGINRLRSNTGDVLFLVDDFTPTGGARDLDKVARVDDIVRAQFSGASNVKSNTDGSTREEKPVRGLLVITGEALPPGHSLRSRMVCIHFDTKIEARLDAYKIAGEQGIFASVMAAFIAWLAEDLDARRKLFTSSLAANRSAFEKRTKEMRSSGELAEFAAAFGLMLGWARDRSLLHASTYEALVARARSSFEQLARDQIEAQQAQNPVQRFVDLIRSALLSGRAHVLHGVIGKAPDPPALWGWRTSSGGVGHDPCGERIGFVEGDLLYLQREAALAVARKLAEGMGDPFPLGTQALADRLYANRMLAKDEMESRKTKTVRYTFGGKTIGGYLCMRSEHFDLAQAAIPPPTANAGSFDEGTDNN